MKKIYTKIWSLAKPYYVKGRSQDVDHVLWLMNQAEIVCKKEKVDDSILIPLVILHDVGYAEIPKENSFKKNIRRLHMKEGEKISRKILAKLDYPKPESEKICYYVSIHDFWALGNNKIFREEKILGIFSDLDFLWMASSKGFETVRKMLNKTPEQMLKFIEQDEKHSERPLCTKTAKELYKKLIKKLKNKYF